MSLILKILKKKKGYRKYIGPKRIIIIIFLIFLFLWGWEYYKNDLLSPKIVEYYIQDYPLYSLLLFIGLYAILIIGSMPSLPMNLAAGFFWGGLLGGIYSALAVTIGGWIAFLLSRYLFGQPLTNELENKWLKKIQKEYKQNEWKFIAFVRINPIMPTAAINYLLGLTSVSSNVFLWATFAFLLPPSLFYAYIGENMNTLLSEQVTDSDYIKAIIIISCAVTIIAGLKLFNKIYKK